MSKEKTELFSGCHQAPVTLVSKEEGAEITRHLECTKCGKPCDGYDDKAVAKKAK